MATLNNQSLIDIALQQYGSLEAIVELAMSNGKSVTSDLQVSEVLQIGEPIARDIVKYFEANSYKIATGAEMYYPPTRVIILSQTTLAFGTVEVGSSNSLSFTISNNGNSTLTVSSISLPFASYTSSFNSGNISGLSQRFS